jgi:hypothetical protein
MVNMLNVRYFITSFRLPTDLFPLVQSDQRGEMVYQNPGVMPRAFFVRDVLHAENDHDVFAAINSPSFNAAMTAVLEKPLPVQITPPDSTSAEITEYEAPITVKTYLIIRHSGSFRDLLSRGMDSNHRWISNGNL